VQTNFSKITIPKNLNPEKMNVDDDASMDDISFKTIHSKKKLDSVRKGRVVADDRTGAKSGVIDGPDQEGRDNGDFF